MSGLGLGFMLVFWAAIICACGVTLASLVKHSK